ncbi:MAG: GNAT family N-acetyltransferase [Roseomonas sp.]|nr:GNAT family N-acetyltransferase [Roseomonas sp.]
MSTPWREQPLSRSHDRKSFDCGEPALNEFLARYARQSHASGGAKTFVVVDPAMPQKILGFYSLSVGALAYARTPALLTRGLGRHEVPVFRLGRLAVAREWQGQGMGGALLIAAGRRCLAVAQEVGGVALLIDAKSDRAAQWYESFGACRLEDAPLSLVLPLGTIAQAMEGV